MVAAQQLSGMTHFLISQQRRIEDGLGFVFLKITKETKPGTQLNPHHESCCSRWKRVPFQWALTINLGRNVQQGFSQLHFPGSLTPGTSKTHFKKKKKKISFESPFKGWEWGNACRCAQAQRGGSQPDTFLRNVSPLIRMAVLSGDPGQGRSSAQSRCSAPGDYTEISAQRGWCHLIKQPVCSLRKISEVQLVQSALSAMPLRCCAPDD